MEFIHGMTSTNSPPPSGHHSYTLHKGPSIVASSAFKTSPPPPDHVEEPLMASLLDATDLSPGAGHHGHTGDSGIDASDDDDELFDDVFGGEGGGGQLFDEFGFRIHEVSAEELVLCESQAKRVAEQELKFNKLHAKSAAGGSASTKAGSSATTTDTSKAGASTEKAAWTSLQKQISVKKQAIPASHTKTFKTLIRHGVPPERRREMWLEMSGVRALMLTPGAAGLYTSILRDNCGKSSAAIKQIALDLPRTFPTNAFFRQSRDEANENGTSSPSYSSSGGGGGAGGEEGTKVGPGMEPLQRVLAAFSWRRSDIGYGSEFLCLPYTNTYYYSSSSTTTSTTGTCRAWASSPPFCCST